MEASVSTVKRRGYDASGRAAAATRRRQAVLDACRDLLVHNGYQATTVKAVAERAGVSTEMIYKSFGGKKQLVKSLYDVTVAGDDEPVPIGERPDIRHILATSDPHEKLARYGAFVRSYQERTNVLLHVFTAANPDIAEIRATIEGERLSGLRTFVAHLASEGHLRSQLTLDAAADACWVLTSPQVFAQLTQARKWSADDYQRWITEMLLASLLDRATP